MGELWGRFGPDDGSNRHIVSLSSLFDSSPIATLIVDAEARLQFFNHAARSIFKLNDDEIGRPMIKLDQASAGQDSLQQALQRAKEKGQSILHLDLPDMQGLRTCDLIITTLKDEKGVELGALLKVRDSYGVDAEAEISNAPLEILAKTSSDITDNADLAGTISNELGKLVESLNLDFAVFRLTAPDGKATMICHGVDYRRGREILETKLKDDGPLYESVVKGDLFICEDAPTDDRILNPPQGVHSFVCVTIRWMKKIYGCAVFGSMPSYAKIKSHIPVLQVFCNQVAISIRNVALWKELAGRNSELRALYETSRAVSSTLELKEVLMTILQKSRSLVGAGNCSIFSMDDAGRKLKCIANFGEDKELTKGVELRVGEGITGLVAQKGEGLLVERADLDNRTILVAGSNDQPSSLISVPLKVSDKTVGVMTLERILGAPFSRKEYELIEMFSVQAATAIYNASLYSLQRTTACNLQMYNTLLTHDVANFNVPIHSYLEMLLRDPKLDERQRRYVRNALAQSENITDLVMDVRELTRLKSRLGEKPLEPMDIVPFIKEAMGDIQANPLYGEVETTFLPGADEKAVVECDTFLKSLFYNLLSNACKHGGGSAVNIKLIPCNHQGVESWRIEVSDGGKGIPDERKVQLFKRLDQLEKEQGADGHGIGLSVVGALCDRYGGQVWVEDRVPGDYSKGSVFVVMLPKAENPPMRLTGIGGELAGVK